jgi:hypothetical protein
MLFSAKPLSFLTTAMFKNVQNMLCNNEVNVCAFYLREARKEGKPSEIYDGSIDLTPWDLAAA